jgi:hypothetical protein
VACAISAALAASPANTGAPSRTVYESTRNYWSYQPIARESAPSVKDTSWVRTDIDRFVLAKLESKGLHPGPDAEPEALVRRVYFDLIGLPPTPEQIDAYVNDPSSNRYERLVDQLIASPQFGERWGRHWLDVARYGESLTLRGFILQNAWRYRDYVINAFNSDLPYDRFMEEQISGDLMPAKSLDERRQQLVATAFLAIGNNNLEEQDKKQLEMDIVDEQINAISTAFLGQTVGCARCHDHKFDPIPTRDYYALAGILHSTQTVEHSNVSKWLETPLPVDPEREKVLAKHEAEVAVVQAQLNAAKAAVAKASAKGGAKSIDIASLPGIVVDDRQAKMVGTWRESRSVPGYIGDGYLTDNNQHADTKTLTFQPDIPESGKYEVRFAYSPGPSRASNVQVTVFSADGDKMVVVNEKHAPPIDGHFVSLGQHTFDKNGQGFVLVSNQDANGHVTADAVQFLPADAATPAAATTSVAVADPAHPATADTVKKLTAALKKLLDEGPNRDTVISVRESKEMGDTRVHIRGNVHTLADPAPRGFLRVIQISHPPAIPANESGRLELGQWLANPQNPLPARVMVNRCWHWLFGAGIVRTTDNFGTTGELPSHPELLDYLAGKFIEDGWSVKSIVRRIVLSHAYQLATDDSDPKASAADPENRLIWRGSRRRLDAECIRDAMLSASGELSLDAGGSSFPPALTADFNYKAASNRRSVYLPAFRNALPEIFEAFDFADPSVSTGRRNVSTVAPQALFMRNSPFVIEQADRTADRLLTNKDCTDDGARIRRAYRLTIGREPSEAELKVATEFLGQPTDGDSTGPNRAWSQFVHALFESMDFRYVN